MLNHFLPYRLLNLATNISNSCSTIYKNDFDLTIPEWRILARLAEHERLNAKNIGKITFMDKSKVSRAVKLLDEKGYLKKEKDQHDNRASYLSLTDEGKTLHQQISPIALNWEKQLISVLDASEYRDLMRIMDKLDQQVALMDKENPHKQ